MTNPAKVLLRKKIAELLKQTSAESRSLQSKAIAEKVCHVRVIESLTILNIFSYLDYQSMKALRGYQFTLALTAKSIPLAS